MLIPRFSIRWLLGLTTLSAGVSMILSYAIRGEAWALGVLTGLGSLLLLAMLYAVTFSAAWLAWRTMGTMHDEPPGHSPFAKSPVGEMVEAPFTEGPPITG